MCLKQGNVKDVKVSKRQNFNISREMLKMLKMLMFFGEFGGGLQGDPPGNFNIFNISPVLSTFA